MSRMALPEEKQHHENPEKTTLILHNRTVKVRLNFAAEFCNPTLL
jgi:hypothetical protein